MLERVRAEGLAETVLADAATLDLRRRFDGVVLASYLVNHPTLAPSFLATCRRHVGPEGAVVVQRYDPIWSTAGESGSATSGDVTIAVDRPDVQGTDLRFGVTYHLGAEVWHQEVRAKVVDDDALQHLAAEAGLRLHRWLDAFRSWAVLVPVGLRVPGRPGLP